MGQVDHVMLPTGVKMPLLGLGTWSGLTDGSSEDKAVLKQAITSALDAGYTMLDTAYSYQNEHIIGEVLSERFKEGKTKREDIFVTTKLAETMMSSEENIHKCVNTSLANLQLDYVDLYLIHAPWAIKEDGTLEPDVDLVKTWQVMEHLVDQGKARAIGVSNFTEDQIQRIQKVARHPICNNQIEVHAYFQQPELVRFCQEKNITVTAYSPLGTPGHIALGGSEEASNDSGNLLEDSIIKSLAAKYNRTPAQILLAHLRQRGIAAIPKSKTPSRIRENIQSINIHLSNDDMKTIEKLDKGLRIFHMKVYAAHPEFKW